jgi:hypothetical protein
MLQIYQDGIVSGSGGIVHDFDVVKHFEGKRVCQSTGTHPLLEDIGDSYTACFGEVVDAHGGVLSRVLTRVILFTLQAKTLKDQLAG